MFVSDDKGAFTDMIPSQRKRNNENANVHIYEPITCAYIYYWKKKVRMQALGGK